VKGVKGLRWPCTTREEGATQGDRDAAAGGAALLPLRPLLHAPDAAPAVAAASLRPLPTALNDANQADASPCPPPPPPQVLENNYKLKMMYSPDYRGMDTEKALAVGGGPAAHRCCCAVF
jgi:hypothetical protein